MDSKYLSPGIEAQEAGLEEIEVGFELFIRDHAVPVGIDGLVEEVSFVGGEVTNLTGDELRFQMEQRVHDIC